MGWQRPEWADWHGNDDPRYMEDRRQQEEEYCPGCDRVRTETCVACGDDDDEVARPVK